MLLFISILPLNAKCPLHMSFTSYGVTLHGEGPLGKDTASENASALSQLSDMMVVKTCLEVQYLQPVV